MHFSAATTAGRVLPQRLALRMAPLLDRIDAVLFTADERGEALRMTIAASRAMIFEASALSFTVWRKLGIVMPIFVPAARGDA